MKKNETDGSTYRDFNFTSIPYSKCVIGKNFQYKDKVEIEDFHIDGFYCPDSDQLIL